MSPPRPKWKDTSVYGVFAVGKARIAVHKSSLDRVVEVDAVHTFPGQPHGIAGLINVKGWFVPLVDTRVVLESHDLAPAMSTRAAALLTVSGELFAVAVDDVVALTEAVAELGDDEAIVLLDCESIWKRIAVLNEG